MINKDGALAKYSSLVLKGMAICVLNHST